MDSNSKKRIQMNCVKCEQKINGNKDEKNHLKRMQKKWVSPIFGILWNVKRVDDLSKPENTKHKERKTLMILQVYDFEEKETESSI